MLPDCIRVINDKWMWEFLEGNIMKNNFHSTLRAKLQTEIEEVEDQSPKIKQVSVGPKGHVHVCTTW